MQFKHYVVILYLCLEIIDRESRCLRKFFMRWGHKIEHC